MYLHQGGRFDGCLPPPHVEVLWHAAGANVVGWVVRSFLGDGVEKDFGELQEFSGVLGRHRRHGGLRRHLHPGVHASMQRLTSGKRRDGVRHRKKVGSLHLKQPVGEAAAHQNEDRVWAQAVGGNALAVGEFDEQARIRKRGDEQEDPIVDVERNQELVLWSGFSGDLEDANFRIIRRYTWAIFIERKMGWCKGLQLKPRCYNRVKMLLKTNDCSQLKPSPMKECRVN